MKKALPPLIPINPDLMTEDTVAEPTLLKKRKKAVGLEIEAKKIKIESMSSFGAAYKDNHSVQIANEELFEPKSEIDMEEAQKCVSKPELQEIVKVKAEPDVVCESVAIQESDAFSDQVGDPLYNMETNKEETEPELVQGDYPIIKLPFALSTKELLVLYQKHKVKIPKKKMFLFELAQRLESTMKKQHPIHETLSKMSSTELRDIHNFPIGETGLRGRIANHYFKRHRKSPLTSFLKDKEETQDASNTQILDDILDENMTNDKGDLGSLFDVIADIQIRKVKALIWYSGDHSMDYNSPTQARKRLAKICLQAKPHSPLSYVISLEVKYNSEVGRGYKEAVKKASQDALKIPIQPKKSKLDTMSSFGPACEDDHSVQIANKEVVESKSETDMEETQKCISKPVLQEIVKVKAEPDVVHEIAALQEPVPDSDQATGHLDNIDTNGEETEPELVLEDYPIIKLPSTLSKNELEVLYKKHKIEPPKKMSLTQRAERLEVAMKKQHPIHETLLKMSLTGLRRIHDFAIREMDENTFSRSDENAFMRSDRFRRIIANHYFKRHRKSPLTSFLKDKEATKDASYIQILHESLDKSMTTAKEHLGSLYDVIGNTQIKKVKAMIWHSGDHSTFSTPKQARKRLAKICLQAKPQSPLSHFFSLEVKYHSFGIGSKEASEDPLNIEIQPKLQTNEVVIKREDILRENVTDDQVDLGSFYDVIANMSKTRVKALIWYSGDHSMEDYSPEEARARLALICLQAKPQSPLPYVISLDSKYNSENGRAYKEAAKNHEDDPLRIH